MCFMSWGVFSQTRHVGFTAADSTDQRNTF
jgi:hypothetical protein